MIAKTFALYDENLAKGTCRRPSLSCQRARTRGAVTDHGDGREVPIAFDFDREKVKQCTTHHT